MPAGRAAAALLPAALAGASLAAAGDAPAPVPLLVRLSDQANALWAELPADPGDARLTRLGGAPTECVALALGEARRLLGREQGAALALREVSLTLAVPRTVLGRLARGEAPASLLAPYVTPATRGALVAQPLGDPSCGAYYDLGGAQGHGTKIVVSDLGSPNQCRRVFDESWQISQNGSSLDVAVATIVSDCGPPVCPGRCVNGDTIPRRHLGTVSGSTALIYPYPDYQTPSCALPLTLQGSTLRGFMPACQTEQPLPVSMDVVLQRVTR